jgi:hypothetical protein
LSEAQARLPSFNGDIAQVERRLWESADQLRANSNLSASEYSVPVLGLRANIGMAINEAMRAVEAENEELKDVLPKTYNRLGNATLVALLKNFSEIPLDLEGDVFGRIYEYFLGKFAMSEGQRGGGFLGGTPPFSSALLPRPLRLQRPKQNLLLLSGKFPRSDSWLSLEGHPEAMKMGPRRPYFHCENVGGD